MRIFYSVISGIIFCVSVTSVSFAATSTEPNSSNIVLTNKTLTVEINRRTGAWESVIDRATGDNLVVGKMVSAAIMSAQVPAIDMNSVQQALTSGKAISIEGEWLFCADPPGGGVNAGFLNGDFSAGDWKPTPVPSQTGIGDNRLHNMAGEFWYRTTFVPRTEWRSSDLVLVVGAIDDTDVVYLNGERIGSTGTNIPNHWEAPRIYKIPSKLLNMDGPNNLLIKVYNGAFDGGIVAGPVLIGLSSAINSLEPPLPPVTHAEASRDKGKTTAIITAISDPFEYTARFETSEDSMLLTRTITVRNVSDIPQILSNVTYPMPFLKIGDFQTFSFPGSLPVGANPISGLLDGETTGSRGMDPLAILWDDNSKCGIGMWFHSEDEWAPVSVRRGGEGAAILHTQQILAPLEPGQSVTLGTQYIWLDHGNRDAVLKDVHKVYDIINLRPPSDGFPDLMSQVMYCGHPGGVPEHGYMGYGGFKALEEYVPTLKRMGITILWLLPIWEHGDGTVWNLYSPFDHFKISYLYGTPDELKHLSAVCAENGISLVFDLVPHGPPDISPLAKEHPDWVCRDRDGNPIYNWSQLAFEYAHPGWQDYMRRAAEFDAKEYGAVGARVDCGAGGPMNWKPLPGLRPSQSGLYGALQMNKAIRDGFINAGKKPILMPEEYTGANIFYRVSDITYDVMLFFLMVDLKAKEASPEEWAQSFAKFLHDQSLTLPNDAIKMRFISNHDTVSWTYQAKRPIDVYGLQGMRALLALCGLIDGVPMLYQGDEDPSIYGGKGEPSVDFLAKIYNLRKSVPAISKGASDYESVRATGGVFTCLRKSGKSKAIVIISFDPEPVKSDLSLPSELEGDWEDQISGERISLSLPSTISMSGYQVRVLIPVK